MCLLTFLVCFEFWGVSDLFIRVWVLVGVFVLGFWGFWVCFLF